MNCIHLNGYSIGIIVEDKLAILKNNNMFVLPQKSEYKIKLSNCNDTKCDVIIWIDNIQMGVWRLDSYTHLTIERPLGIDKRLMFNDHTSGSFIKAEFRPEKSKGPKYNFYHMISDDRSAKKTIPIHNYKLTNVVTYGTTLGKKSNQQFKKTPIIKNIDHRKITTIYALLV